MLGLSAATWSLLLLVCLVGAGIQSSAGLGLGLLLSPALSFVAPGLLPAVPLILYAVSGALIAARDWRHLDHRVVVWGSAGLLPGLGVGLVGRGAVPAHLQPVVLGAGVLLVVLLSVVWESPRRPRGVATAGGFGAAGLGVMSGVVSPPMSLATHGLGRDASRATTAVITLTASVGGLVLLAPSGVVTPSTWMVALVLLPAMVVGLLVGRRLGSHLHGTRFRVAVLSLVTITGVSVLTKAVI